MAQEIERPTLHHVTLKTTRLREMADWYSTVVGMKATHFGAFGAWLTNDAANHRVALLVAPGLEDDPHKVQHTGLHHSAYEYPSVDGLLQTYVRLKAENIIPHACLDHGMTLSFYYVDPDGNSVELQFDEFGDWAASTHFMETSEAFNTNPIGISVDPELIVAARKAGASAEAIHARAYAGEFEPDTSLDLRLPDAPS